MRELDAVPDLVDLLPAWTATLVMEWMTIDLRESRSDPQKLSCVKLVSLSLLGVVAGFIEN